MRAPDYVPMRDIGDVFGVSSHVIGRWLNEAGLRHASKRPTKNAIDGGFVYQGLIGYGAYWHHDKVVKKLINQGHTPKDQPPDLPEQVGGLIGPFTPRRNSLNGYEIVGGDGSVAVWVFGEENADRLVRLMNAAYEHGKFV